MSDILLSDGTTTLTLPGGLDWEDEYAWAPVEQTMTRSVTGTPIVQIAGLVAGRPITLTGSAQRAWVLRSVCDSIQAWAGNAGKALTLTIRGVGYPVYFRHQDKPAFSARPIADLANPPADWPHYVTLKFMTRSV